MKRREFLTLTGLMTVSGLAPSVVTSCSSAASTGMKVDDFYETDVLVVGGGPAGVCAAIAAAREGVQVMIVETGGCLGGMATRGLVGPFMTCYDTTGEQMIIKGIFEEIIDRMVLLLKERHTSRLCAGTCNINSGLVFMDALTYFERTADQCSNTAMRILGKKDPEIMKNHHAYLHALHTSGDQSYRAEQENRRLQYLVPLETME